MTPCPDWRTLVAHRYGDPTDVAEAAEPAGWDAALAHLDDCPACRAAAAGQDPTLVFARQPAVRVEPAEIADMRSAVAAMRRAGRVTGTSGPASSRVADRASWPVVRRAAAAAVLAAGLLAVTGVSPPEMPASAHAVASLPVIEDLDRPSADVYHFDGGDLAVVMIVDSGLDV